MNTCFTITTKAESNIAETQLRMPRVLSRKRNFLRNSELLKTSEVSNFTKAP